MSTTCELCNAASESIDHLFYICPVIKQLWRDIGTALGTSFNFSNRIALWEEMWDFSRPRSSRLQAQVDKIIIPATLWAIWLGRNNLIFSGERFYIENIWDNAIAFVSAWGCSLAGARRVRIVRGELQIEPS
ncbi:hypothetical protein QJS10_CPB04g00880 [Acorus calamus]|uniref:Reverse transcriptase zinc-binding domain-containing protein n=1 Tax=Acorus calamus TaxID=4465 RepID=A0AAV9EYY5_ACOCL|nr:hypothetical protein QJS10_CPB04g00880 [Acorus calamus]